MESSIFFCSKFEFLSTTRSKCETKNPVSVIDNVRLMMRVSAYSRLKMLASTSDPAKNVPQPPSCITQYNLFLSDNNPIFR